jgi:phosphoglycerol transferase MdoB-like AlkP superfamily enzyme
MLRHISRITAVWKATAQYRPLLAVAVALLITVLWSSASPRVTLAVSSGILAGYWFSLLVLTPLGWAVKLLLGSAVVVAGLHYISKVKVELTQLPLMPFDLRLAVAYPVGFLDAMDASAPVRTIIFIGATLLFGGFAVAIGREALLYRRRSPAVPRSVLNLAAPLLGVILITLQAVLFVEKLPGIVASSAFANRLWEPHGVAALERRMGTVPFLFYIYSEERNNRGRALLQWQTVDPPPQAEVEAAIERFLLPESVPSDRLPNIVMVMMESTFDINSAFNFAVPATSTLLSGHDALLVGSVRVNVVGGGSWVSEFESLTGIDSRFFGYSGYYTHAAIAPYMRHSLVTWFRSRGYSTAAFYPVSGNFYNARRAYGMYGFEDFFDNDDLGFPGWTTPDSVMVAHYLRKLADLPEPFFAYLVLTENHGPHTCRNFENSDQFLVRLTARVPFGLECEVNEYVRRLESTERALEKAEQYLRGRESRSDRPYLVAAFGDHQPHTFTGTGSFSYDYGPYRTTQDLNTAIFRIGGSVSNRIVGPTEQIPLSLLPSVVSGFASSSAAEVYLGVNFLLAETCGADLFGGRSITGPASLHTSGPSGDCDRRLAQAASTYQNAGLFEIR